MFPSYFETIDKVYAFFWTAWMAIGWISLFVWSFMQYVYWKQNKISRLGK